MCVRAEGGPAAVETIPEEGSPNRELAAIWRAKVRVYEQALVSL